MIEVVHVGLPCCLARPRAAEPHRRSSGRKRHYPRRKNCISRSSLPRMRETIRQGTLPVHEDACRLALAGSPRRCSPARPKVLCDEGTWGRVIFAERLPSAAAHYGRCTERLQSWLTHVSFALGGEAGSRLLKDLGIVVFGDTLPHHIRSLQLRDHETPRDFSVDDFAFHRGTRYGTVLVGLNVTRWWMSCSTGARILSPAGFANTRVWR